MDAYRVGAIFLADPDPIGAGQPHEALKLLDKGIRAHPQDWRLYYDKGFIYYSFLQDYRAAGETWLAASRLSSAPQSGWRVLPRCRCQKAAPSKLPWLYGNDSIRNRTARTSRRMPGTIYCKLPGGKGPLDAGIPPGEIPGGNGLLSRKACRSSCAAKGAGTRLRIPSGIPYDYDPQTGESGSAPSPKIQIPEACRKPINSMIYD